MITRINRIGEVEMSLEELENKQAISEVINKFSALELDVDKQSELFTPDTHIEIFMDGNKVLSKVAISCFSSSDKSISKTSKFSLIRSG